MFYKASVSIDQVKAAYIDTCLTMNADELYDKFGVKRYEQIFTTTAKFADGREIDINVCSCEEDPPYIDVVLFNANGNELACAVDEDDTIVGEKGIDYNDDSYVVEIITMKG